MGRKFAGIDEMAAAARELVAGGIETVVVSLGGDGALFVRKDQTLRGKGLKVPVLSTVGAGDSMMATLCHGVETGMSFIDTCRLGHGRQRGHGDVLGHAGRLHGYRARAAAQGGNRNPVT